LKTGLSFVPIALISIAHACFPQSRPYTEPLLKLSYYDPATRKYALGPQDFAVVFFWVLLLTGLRAAALSYALMPLARLAGVRTLKARVRFAEQAWLFLYDSAFFSLGLVCNTSLIPTSLVSLLVFIFFYSVLQENRVISDNILMAQDGAGPLFLFFSVPLYKKGITR
jgi:hypothetical protein